MGSETTEPHGIIVTKNLMIRHHAVGASRIFEKKSSVMPDKKVYSSTTTLMTSNGSPMPDFRNKTSSLTNLKIESVQNASMITLNVFGKCLTCKR